MTTQTTHPTDTTTRAQTSPTSTPVDKFDAFWAATSDADRNALLGHTRATLSTADKVRLAKVARAAALAPSPRR